MSKSKKLRVEEYVPAATFLLKIFVRDREEMSGRFSEFTEEYETGFESQIDVVKDIEQSLLLTEEQRKVTEELYAASDALSKELDFLTFHFKRAALYPGVLTMLKKELRKRNIEGACQKLGGLIQYTIAEHEILESKGMVPSFPAQLAVIRADLALKNSVHNDIMDNKDQLYGDNNEAFKLLYEYITTVANAGNVIFDGQDKEDEYMLSKLIGRMRSKNVVRREVQLV